VSLAFARRQPYARAGRADQRADAVARARL